MTVATKCAVISIIGAPNAGKSTLVNRLVGSKVSIVTPKVQTTRNRITGIVTEGNTQLVIVDTPGIFRPKKKLDKAMVKAAWDSTEGVDFTALIVDSKKGISNEVEMILQYLRNGKGKNILLLNKVDITKKSDLLALASQLNEKLNFEKIFMISAVKGGGVEDFVNYIKENAKEEPFLYPEDQASDIPLRLFAAEITREKLMMKLDQELPYKLMVETENWEEKKDSITIRQVIYVESEGQKKIVIGKGGKTIKDVGEKSRRELAYLLKCKVNLFTFVKVRENWQDREENYATFGLGSSN